MHCANIVTFSVMASTVPLIGWVHGLWGFEILFPMLSVAAVAIFFAVLFIPTKLAAATTAAQA